MGTRALAALTMHGLLTGAALAQPVPGPDIYVHNLTDVMYYGNVGGPTPGGIYAYAVGTNACNAGDQPIAWFTGGNQHPVIAQNFYRYKDGRLEQIGQSWLKHGFGSANGQCPVCQPPPLGGQQLGVGCSDAYGAGSNGYQDFLGPRSDVNATTGYFPPTHISPGTGTPIAGRLQVHYPDVDPAQNAGARYFAEGHYVTADDASFADTPRYIHGNGLNNATWCEIDLSDPTADWIPFLGEQHATQPGIAAWQAVDPLVWVVSADYMDHNLIARFVVAGRVTDNGNGTWTYEYAVENLNADRSAGSFSVPLPTGVVLTNIGFHDVDSHSGEPYDLTDWTASVHTNEIVWATQSYAQNANANALRFSTMYNFWLTANAPPTNNGAVTLGLFKPPTAASPDRSVLAPMTLLTPGNICGSADYNGDGDTGTDADIESFFACLAGNCCATCPGNADFNGDGDVGTDADIEAFFRVLGGGGC